MVDDGSGMSETDARMCLERHATSKIRNADDLFSIRTMGFRGEALASIAAISHLELKTKRKEDELGTEIQVEGTVVKSQDHCSCVNGTSFSVKNLFYNVPARRNFLKSDPVEINQIQEEFIRVALVNQDINFILVSNNKEIFNLPTSNIRQRIIHLFGSGIADKLVPVQQKSEVVQISGFIGKPERARKSRGEQYFFVNGRFIKHPYFHYAVDSAYQQLIPEKYYPAYFIHFEVNPAELDVNIHPTKTEVKFQHEKVIYSILHSAVRQGLGRFSLTPSIDFDTEPGFDLSTRPADKPVVQPQIRINPDYNPFGSRTRMDDPLNARRERSNKENWEKMFQSQDREQAGEIPAAGTDPEEPSVSAAEGNKQLYQFKNRYIVCSVHSGMMLIDQQRAHERVIFEKLLQKDENQEIAPQQELFPVAVKLSSPEASLLNDLLKDIRHAGFVIEPSRHQTDTFMVSAVPFNEGNINFQEIIEEMLDHYQHTGQDARWDRYTRIAASAAKNLSIKGGKAMQTEEMNNLFDELFACRFPEATPDGKSIITIVTMEEIANRFK
ncbi:MAG: DNA mismatch repair endonuclease MutL [Bacteroidetes bacterium]|nr:DNA mismatch repair endonuclease MutL [Bacteroidota bacterium]